MSGNGDRTILRVKSHEDLIHQVATFQSFRIQDRHYSAEMLIPQLIIDNKDLVTEAAMCAAFVGYWGREAARARRWQAQVEAAYRAWRDRTWVGIKQTPNGETDKGTAKFPTDAFTDKLLHMHPEYGDWRGRRDDSQEAAENAEAIHEAFKLKGRLIENQQRLLRDEAGGPYHVVEDPRQTQAREPKLS